MQVVLFQYPVHKIGISENLFLHVISISALKMLNSVLLRELLFNVVIVKCEVDWLISIVQQFCYQQFSNRYKSAKIVMCRVRQQTKASACFYFMFCIVSVLYNFSPCCQNFNFYMLSLNVGCRGNFCACLSCVCIHLYHVSLVEYQILVTFTYFAKY